MQSISNRQLVEETMGLDRAQDRPKILFVTSHWPLAAAYGAQQRVLNIARLLSRFGDVSWVIVPTEQEDEETARRTKREFEVCRVIRPSLLAPDSTSGRLPRRLRHEFHAAHMATDPYVVSEPDRAAMQELIQQHDVIWVHTIRTANWFRIYRWPHSVLDVDDLVSRQQQSVAQSDGSRTERLLSLRRSWIWRRRERIFPKRFDVLTVCSEEDRRRLGGHERIHVIPNGAPRLEAGPRAFSEVPRIGLIGNCTYPPNEDGLKWFIRDVWPLIKREFPRADLRLVGRGSEGYLTKLGPDITGLGWLEDPKDEIASWSAMIVPIKLGSGTRVKVAEGFARRCPVVSTTIGAFGYDVENEREVLLADRADDFASACIRLLKHPEHGQALSERAHKRFLERWTWDSFESTVGTVVHECLARSKRAQLPGIDVVP
jgi:glycosyltransferase involved in cell wall biosynthesis